MYIVENGQVYRIDETLVDYYHNYQTPYKLIRAIDVATQEMVEYNEKLVAEGIADSEKMVLFELAVQTGGVCFASVLKYIKVFWKHVKSLGAYDSLKVDITIADLEHKAHTERDGCFNLDTNESIMCKVRYKKYKRYLLAIQEYKNAVMDLRDFGGDDVDDPLVTHSAPTQLN